LRSYFCGTEQVRLVSCRRASAAWH